MAIIAKTVPTYPSLKPKYYPFIDGASTEARSRGKL
jgi:hypothetical protein